MSIAAFSPLEIQLVRASLSTKTTEDISLLLERSAEDVTELINDITDGKAEERESDVKLYVLEREKAKVKRGRKISLVAKVEKKLQKERDSIRGERLKKKQESEQAWHAQRKKFQQSGAARKYKTRVIDYSKLITVKLDEKTWAQIEVQDTKEKTEALITKTKETYEANKSLNKFKIAEN